MDDSLSTDVEHFFRPSSGVQHLRDSGKHFVVPWFEASEDITAWHHVAPFYSTIFTTRLHWTAPNNALSTVTWSVHISTAAFLTVILTHQYMNTRQPQKKKAYVHFSLWASSVCNYICNYDWWWYVHQTFSWLSPSLCWDHSHLTYMTGSVAHWLFQLLLCYLSCSHLWVSVGMYSLTHLYLTNSFHMGFRHHVSLHIVFSTMRYWKRTTANVTQNSQPSSTSFNHLCLASQSLL